MPVGKPLNNNYYTSGKITDIEMPPLTETPPVAAAPDPWQQQSAVAPVPDTVPHYTEEDNVSLGEGNETRTDETEEYEEPEEAQASAPQERQKESPANRRIRELKEENRRIQEERIADQKRTDELIRLLNNHNASQQKPEPVEEYKDDLGLEDDDGLAENRHVAAVNKKVRMLERKLETLQQEAIEDQKRSQEQIIESRIKSDYVDFDRVVSTENLATLAKQHPHLAKTLLATDNLYDRAAAAYDMIKGMGISRAPELDNDRLKAITNINKPRPMASLSPQQGKSPLERANEYASGEFNQEQAKKYWKEMEEARKNL